MKKSTLLLFILASVSFGLMAERHTTMLTTTESTETTPTDAAEPQGAQAETSEAAGTESPDVLLPNQVRPARVRLPEDNDRPRMVAQRHFDFNEYLDTKCSAVVKEMGLNAQDSARFVPVYRELQQKKSELYRKYGGNREVRQRIANGENVADSTLMRVVRNYAARQVEDAKIEQQYVDKLSRVLTPLQLYNLQRAEQTFKNDMMRRRNETAKPQKPQKPMKK